MSPAVDIAATNAGDARLVEVMRGARSTQALRSSGESLAACLAVDPDLFFPPTYGALNRSSVAQAKSLCNACTIRSECLELALAFREEHGIWGGATPQERWRMAARRLRKAG